MSDPWVAAPGAPAYLAGLRLAGRKVVAVGGGKVHRRRVPKLLAAGADVTVVAPHLHPDLAALAEAGALRWRAGEFVESDLDGAWYVLAATDSHEVNARVAAAAEARHTFCARADDAASSSSWTPATGAAGDVTFGVLTDHDPLRARALRDRLLALLADADE